MSEITTTEWIKDNKSEEAQLQQVGQERSQAREALTESGPLMISFIHVELTQVLAGLHQSMGWISTKTARMWTRIKGRTEESDFQGKVWPRWMCVCCPEPGFKWITDCLWQSSHQTLSAWRRYPITQNFTAQHIKRTQLFFIHYLCYWNFCQNEALMQALSSTAPVRRLEIFCSPSQHKHMEIIWWY